MRRFLVVMVGMAVLVGSACGDDDGAAADDDTSTSTSTTQEPDGDGTDGGAAPFDLRTFVSTGVSENGQPRPLVEGTEIALDFGPDSQIGIQAGCNSMSGPAEITDDVVKAANLATTEMGCDPPRHAQDEWIAGLFGQGLAYTLDSDKLTLTADGTVITMVDRKTVNPDRALEDTEWKLDGIVQGDGVSSVPQGAVAVVVFSDGEVVVQNEGCNGARGPAEVTETEITIGGLMMTKMGCEPGPTAVEQAITQTLDGTVTYRIDSDRLDVSNANGTGLTFVAMDNRESD